VGSVAEGYGHLVCVQKTALVSDGRLHRSLVYKIQLYLRMEVKNTRIVLPFLVKQRVVYFSFYSKNRLHNSPDVKK
jgi:hypothetical protein